MCHDADSFPPIPVIRGAAVSHDRLTLQAADGNRFAAFQATPDEPSAAGVVILPDVRGLHRFYEELALRFAERGSTAVAFDYFGRTAGAEPRGDDFDYMPHVEQARPETVQLDVAAAAEHLRPAARAIFTVGFCFGGRQSWLAAASGHRLEGAIGFYGRPGPGNDGSPGPAQRAAEMEAPILGLMGGNDPGIPPEEVAKFEEALRAAGVAHELITYPGAPHSFFDRKYEEFADASEDAWRRVLDFIERLSSPPRAARRTRRARAR
jgi:carboxymethylenebutenolidase